MLKLVSFVIAAALAVETTMAQLDLVYILNDPYVQSVKKGFEACSYSSPDWLAAFFHPRLSIDTIFTEFSDGNQDPTVLRSIKITFRRPLSNSHLLTSYYLEQHYSVPTPDFFLSSTFDSGYASVPGWLNVTFASAYLVMITDLSTGSMIEIYRNGNQNYNLFLFAPKSFLDTAGGLLVEGCPYNAVYPWHTSYVNANPNIGRRRRRQVDSSKCEEIAASFGKSFPSLKGFSKENIYKVCETDSGIFENTPEVLRDTLEAAQKALDLYNKNFGERYTPPSNEEFQQL